MKDALSGFYSEDFRAQPGRRAGRKESGPAGCVPAGPEVGDESFAARIYWQPCSLKLLMRVCQFQVPLVPRYSVVNQKVQSSRGSMLSVA